MGGQTVSAGVMELTDLSHMEQDFEKTQCRSTLKGHTEPHEAHFWAISPCEDITPVCARRERKCFRDGGWQCVIVDGSGCNGWHAYEVLTFTPVRE